MNSLELAQQLHADVPPDWYHRSIRNNLLQRFWHRQRFKNVGKLVTPVQGSILDIGSADGVFTDVLLKKSGAKEAVGVDVMQSSVDWANEHWKKQNMRFEVADGHDLPYENSSFDAAFALESLEHVMDPKKVISEAYRVLKPGGYAIFLVPTDNLLFRIIWFFWTKAKGKIWDEAHIQSFTGSSLAQLTEECGFIVDKEHFFLLRMLCAVRVSKPNQ